MSLPLYSARWHGCRADEFLWRGHRLIVLENELLRIGVLASKGADIVEFRYKPRDLDLMWHAPQPVLPPGRFVPSSPRPQGSFLDFYPGGWQEVFPSAGPATEYKGAALGQHGEVSLQPWDVRVIEDLPGRIEVEFAVETMRTPFRLERRMALESGSGILRIRERVTNLGEEPMHYAWGHHPALGAPFVEAGCLLELPDCEVRQTAYAEGLNRRFAAESQGRFPHLPKIDGSQGRVDQIPGSDARSEDVLQFHGFSEGRCVLRNPRQGLAFLLRWPADVFPHLWCWQVCGGSFGYPYYGRAYTVAVEPFNCPIEGLAQSAAAGVVPELAPGSTTEAWLEAEIEARA
ncbi:MAG TPA: DUF4432 family protein [Bryobacteraceae bacterium]|nr:DUF4432 family protein [Bryobacteraceae bacterium]